jgi:hypothetical protein
MLVFFPISHPQKKGSKVEFRLLKYPGLFRLRRPVRSVEGRIQACESFHNYSGACSQKKASLRPWGSDGLDVERIGSHSF